MKIVGAASTFVLGCLAMMLLYANAQPRVGCATSAAPTTPPPTILPEQYGAYYAEFNYLWEYASKKYALSQPPPRLEFLDIDDPQTLAYTTCQDKTQPGKWDVAGVTLDYTEAAQHETVMLSDVLPHEVAHVVICEVGGPNQAHTEHWRDIQQALIIAWARHIDSRTPSE